LQRLVHATQDGQLVGRVVVVPQVRDQNAQGLLRPDRGDAPHHERQEVHLRVGGQFQSTGGVYLGQGFGGVPVHQRQVVVGSVLGVGQQAFKDVPAIFQKRLRHPLQGGRQVEGDDR